MLENRLWGFEATVSTHNSFPSSCTLSLDPKEVHMTRGEMVYNDLPVTPRAMELMS